MLFHRAAVLGSAPDAHRISYGLFIAGVPAQTWILPGECDGRAAAECAEVSAARGEWASRLARTDITVTAFRDPRILDEAVVPYLLPHLPIGSVWLQLGRAARRGTDRLALAAADYEISFLSPYCQAGSGAADAFCDIAVRQCSDVLSGYEPLASWLPSPGAVSACRSPHSAASAAL
ncbi:hypothetical protein [Streptomyces jumonjinensis]|uniref:hypothetical protein n=1 Tax=Streptomyces jumonjinensis TaxID=1945 RepID=UPI00378F0477